MPASEEHTLYNLRAEIELLYKFLDPVLLTYDVISGI